jgi:hypothetical protein
MSQTVAWVGDKDLDVRFVVTDAETGKPISGAQVHILQVGGGFCDKCQEEKEFILTTGPDGSVNYSCGKCMCFGKSGWRIDTFGIHLPTWVLNVSADGYVANELTDVNSYQRTIDRGDKVATAEIPISLGRRGR